MVLPYSRTSLSLSVGSSGHLEGQVGCEDPCASLRHVSYSPVQKSVLHTRCPNPSLVVLDRIRCHIPGPPPPPLS